MKRMYLFIALLTISASFLTAQQGVYRYKVGQPYKYISESRNDMIQDMAGQTFTITIEGTGSMTFTVSSIDENGAMKATTMIENVLVMIESPQETKTFGNELAGKSFGFTLQSNGKVMDRDEAWKSLPAEQSQTISQMLQIFPLLDPSKLSIGESWESNTIDTTKGEGMELVANTTTKFNVKGKKTVKERVCLEILFDGKTKSSGNMTRMGQDFIISGEQDAKGVLFYDAEDGIMVELNTDNSGDQAITSPTNTMMKFNITTSSNSKVEYVP